MWLLTVMGLEHFAGIPQLEVDTPAPLFLLGAGLVSSLSSIPMANTRSWVLNGVCSSVMQLWFAWYVSGAYPACLAPADPWLAAAGFTVLAIAYAEAEETIAKDEKSRNLLRQSQELRKKASGKVLMRKEDHVHGNAVNRYGAMANLALNTPHLFATVVGSGWVERLAEAYPSAPTLLFHAYFALATSTSISLLAPTLYTRRLIDAKAFAAMQFISLAPLVTSAVDASVMGSLATSNPIKIYLGFLQ
ncbi:unnamed protein product [Laminaria digitata]